MAENSHSGTAELGAPMDYAEHERTFNGFVTLTKLAVLAAVDVIIALTLFAFGSGGFWLGVLTIILALAGLAVGLAMKGSARPLIGVTILAVIFFVLSVA